ECGVELASLSSEAACEAGDDFGCAVAASLILEPESLTESFEVDSISPDPRARKFADRGCKLGNEMACRLQVWMNMESNSIAKRVEASEVLEQKCSAGMGSMCYILGSLYEANASRAYDYADALDYYERGCRLEDADACWEAARMREKGLGTDKDADGAEENYRAACELRHDDACNEIDEKLPPVEDEEVAEWNRFASEAITEMNEEACQNGFRHACTFGGRLIERGELHSRYVDDERALSLFEEGCERGSAESCFYQARMVRDGRGTDPHTRRANAIAEESCEAGFSRGCRLERDTSYRLFNEERTASHAERCEDEDGEDRAVDCYLAGQALTYDGLVEPDPERARTLHLIGCDLEYGDSCLAAGRLFDPEEADAAADRERAVKLYETACDLDAKEACYRLGRDYRLGDGVERDMARAVDYFEKGCDLGVPEACGSLGDLLAHGDEEFRDQERAEKLLRRGCGGGDLGACSDLGHFFLDSDSEESTETGLSLLNFACTNDEADACNGLGTFLSDVDDQELQNEAADHLEKGCLIDSASACANLGKMYAEGRGVERDTDRSMRLYQEACDEDHEEACRWLEERDEASQ
ncbi:MAG: tetratricopeptide repeat protein, partial [Persicimonas sp.]